MAGGDAPTARHDEPRGVLAMLTIARLRPSSAARGYYERAAAQDATWSAWTRIPVSEWVGGARTALGRDGPLTRGELTRISAEWIR